MIAEFYVKKKCFTSHVIISHAWKWLFFTKRSRTLRQPSESLCNRRPCYFPFREAATGYSTVCRVFGHNGRHETRQTHERGSLLKTFCRAPVRAFTVPQISNDHRYIIPAPPFCASRSLYRIDIVSTITLHLVHVVIFRRLIAKTGVGKCDKEDSTRWKWCGEVLSNVNVNAVIDSCAIEIVTN